MVLRLLRYLLVTEARTVGVSPKALAAPIVGAVLALLAAIGVTFPAGVVSLLVAVVGAALAWVLSPGTIQAREVEVPPDAHVKPVVKRIHPVTHEERGPEPGEVVDLKTPVVDVSVGEGSLVKKLPLIGRLLSRK